MQARSLLLLLRPVKHKQLFRTFAVDYPPFRLGEFGLVLPARWLGLEWVVRELLFGAILDGQVLLSNLQCLVANWHNSLLGRLARVVGLETGVRSGGHLVQSRLIGQLQMDP